MNIFEIIVASVSTATPLIFGFWVFFKVFFQKYIETKSVNLATKEDFDDLRQQTKRLTLDTESIRTSLSEKNWLRQQNWSMRQQYYSSLLSHLEILRQSLHDRRRYYDDPGSEYDETIPNCEAFKSHVKIGHEAFDDLRRAIGPASIFLPDVVREALESLVAERNFLQYSTSGPKEPITVFSDAVNSVYKAVRDQAIEDLGAQQR